MHSSFPSFTRVHKQCPTHISLSFQACPHNAKAVRSRMRLSWEVRLDMVSSVQNTSGLSAQLDEAWLNQTPWGEWEGACWRFFIHWPYSTEMHNDFPVEWFYARPLNFLDVVDTFEIMSWAENSSPLVWSFFPRPASCTSLWAGASKVCALNIALDRGKQDKAHGKGVCPVEKLMWK